MPPAIRGSQKRIGVGEDRRGRADRRRSVDDEGPDQADVDAADPAGKRKQAAELADQIAHQNHGQRGDTSKAWKVAQSTALSKAQ